jgi:hypothetical protein
MSNSTILYSDCFEYSQKALASKQMDEKALVDLMSQIDGKTVDEVKVVLADSLAKLEDAKKVAETEMAKVEAAVLEVRDVAEDVKKKVEEVSTKCSWCVPLLKKLSRS